MGDYVGAHLVGHHHIRRNLVAIIYGVYYRSEGLALHLTQVVLQVRQVSDCGYRGHILEVRLFPRDRRFYAGTLLHAGTQHIGHSLLLLGV